MNPCHLESNALEARNSLASSQQKNGLLVHRAARIRKAAVRSQRVNPSAGLISGRSVNDIPGQHAHRELWVAVFELK